MMKALRILLTCLLSVSLFNIAYAEETTYKVNDTNSGLNEEFATYNEALAFYNANKDEYDNLVLLNGDKVIDMEYGMVYISGHDGLVDYYSIIRDSKDYISNGYGIDAAYLSSTNNNKVYIKISGDVGYTSRDNVELIPLEKANLSYYLCKDGYLYHNIKYNIAHEYVTSLVLDKALSFMKEDTKYYSYDGHYFYDDYKVMIDDYRNDSYENAINDDAYYNYYMYLPYRSITNYTQDEVEDYLYNTLGINGRLNKYSDLNGDGANDVVNRSQLFENINEFYIDQYRYGCNALMLLSSGIYESSYGKNLDSYINNSIYTQRAYDSNVERQNNRYDNIANSVYAHAKYFISKLYSNYLASTYAGTNFGDKVSGINNEYSIDHYYGEKCASEYFKIDRALGYKDYNSLSLGISNDIDNLVIYKEEELESKKITIKDVPELLFVILDETDSAYKIQIDPSFNSEYLYDYENSVGYIEKSDVNYLLNEDAIHNYDLAKQNYDFNGGKYRDNSSLSVKVIKGSELDIVPSFDGYEFKEYEIAELEDGSIVRKAIYEQISYINGNNLFEKQSSLLPYPNLYNSSIRVYYQNGSSAIKPINTDMITYYDNKDNTEQNLSIMYCGFILEKPIQLDTEYYDEYKKYVNAIEKNDPDYVKQNIEYYDYPLNFIDIIEFDEYFRQDNKRNYVIKDEVGNHDISIAGLDLSIDDRRNFHLIQDTYYVILDEPSKVVKNKLNDYADAYGFKVEDYINLSFKFNYQNVDLRGPVLVQLDLNDDDLSRLYSVYHLNKNGDVIKCRTTRSKSYLQFVIEEKGDYIIMSLPSMGEYDFADATLNLNYSNVGFDNNRINIEFMLGLSLILLALIGILVYYRVEYLKERQWKDYKKSLLKVDTVQEEKQKN